MNGRPTVAYHGGETQSVDTARHIDVGKYNRDIQTVLQNFHRLSGIGSFHCFEPSRFNQIYRCHPQKRLVFDHKNDC